MKPLYEIMLILNPKISDKEIKNILGEIKKSIIAHKGKMVDEDNWGIYKFAYHIKEFEEGYYIILYFHSDPNYLKILEHSLKLDKNILRYLLIRLPKNYKIISYKRIIFGKELKNKSKKRTAEEEIDKIIKKMEPKKEKKEKEETNKKEIKISAHEDSFLEETPPPVLAPPTDQKLDEKLEKILGADLDI